MKILLIYNPYAGSRTFKNNLDSILEKLEVSGYLVTIYRICQGCDLSKLFSSISQDEYTKILIAGGDGTIHHAVNALLRSNITVPIGIYPTGTANDFAYNFYMASSLNEYTKIFTKDNYSYCDLGMVNDEYFVNVASLGCLTNISQNTNPKTKTSFGVFAYYLKGFEEFQKLKAIKIKVISDNFSFKGDVYFMLVMNGRAAGGFKKISTSSLLDDGLLDVFIFKKCPVIEIMNLVAAVLKGEHTKNSNVIHFQSAKFTVESEEKIGTDLDGERGVDFPLEFQAIPNKLKVNTYINKK